MKKTNNKKKTLNGEMNRENSYLLVSFSRTTMK